MSESALSTAPKAPTGYRRLKIRGVRSDTSFMRWRKRHHEGESRSDLARHQEASADRLKSVLSRSHDFGDQDPKEVEARLRNMVYGTNRK